MLDSLPGVLGAARTGQLGLLDQIGVQVHMNEAQLHSCFIQFVQSHRHENDELLSDVKSKSSATRALSVMSWNIHGGMDRSDLHPTDRRKQ